MEEARYEFPYRKPGHDAAESVTSASEEGKRSRRLIVKKTFDDEASPQLLASSTTQQKSTTAASKLKIKLGKGTKRNHASRSKTTSVYGKAKEKPLDPEAIRQLESCISVLQKLSHTSHASALEQGSLPASFVPSLTEIGTSLIEAKNRNWVRSPYTCSKDVLQEAGLYLRSQAVKNEHRRKIVSACYGLLKSLEKLWIDAGFAHDVEALKGINDDRFQESGRLPDSNLRVTKARMEKLKRQEMEKEVKEAEEAIASLEKAKADVEAAKVKLDKAKEALKEASRSWNTSYRAKLNQLTDFGKEKSHALKQKEKALAAIKASQVHHLSNRQSPSDVTHWMVLGRD